MLENKVLGLESLRHETQGRHKAGGVRVSGPSLAQAGLVLDNTGVDI